MNEILLSIIIPTKNRHNVLIPTLDAICKYVFDSRIEFIIQDNSSNNKQMLKYINSGIDPRIKYFYEYEDMDVVQNFNHGISNARGKYLSIIGDDDLINPYIMEIVEIINKASINALIYPRATYYWADVKFFKEFKFFEPASLQIIKDPNLIIHEYSSKDELNHVLSLGGIYLFKLPALYHGIVKKELLESIYKKHDSYVLGPSPDMSLAVSLALELKSYHYINFPVTIAGASYDSAAGMGRRGAHRATLDSLPSWLPKDISNNWDPFVPKFWNGFTVYAQSIFLVLKHYKNNCNIDYLKLYDKILKDDFRDIIFLKNLDSFMNLEFSKRKSMIYRNWILNMLKRVIIILPSLFLNFIVSHRSSFKNLKHIKKISDVDSCMRWLQVEYKNQFLK